MIRSFLNGVTWIYLQHVQDPGFPRIIDFAIGTIDNHE